MIVVKEKIEKKTKGNVTTIYIHGNYARQLLRELEENCEFLVYVEKLGFFYCIIALIHYFQIISKFTRN